MKTAEVSAERASAIHPSALARIEEVVRERACEEQRLRRGQLERAEGLAREARSRSQDLFGAERHAQWRRFLRERRAERRRRPLPPLDAAALETRLERQTTADRAAALRLLEEWRVTPDALLGTRREAGTRVAQALRPWYAGRADELEIRGPGPAFGVTHGDAEIAVNTFVPPYSGTSSSSSWSENGAFDLDRDAHADRQTGLVGQSLEISNHDASDADFGLAEDHRQISQLYVMPHSGRITVLITMVIEKASHGLSLEDEWGLSLSDVEQNNYLTLATTGSDGQPTAPVRAQISRYQKTRNTGGQWIVPAYPAGTTFVVAHTSPATYSQDELVRLDVGSLSTNQVYTDDMEVRSRISFRHRIERLVVTVLP